ncbi:MAG: Glucosamine-6-phosphate deaminase 1 [Candidatus Marinimicrobia bacterium]|nr:Glucosamine-6-phosphate deaminase 1 [Candidatus Neomarinimicrobiota bacterium]
MLVTIKDDYESMSEQAAQIVAEQIRRKPDSVIGFATGSTPLGLYNELIRMHRETGLDFSKITTFNLDEYVGLPPEHDQGYHYFMWENLFKHINVDPRHVYIPDGMADDIDYFCEWYEEQMAEVRGLDLQILGIGANGHIAFNEPGSSLGSRTRIKTLTSKTVKDNARFFDDPEEVPKYAITMGIGTIMDARKLVLVASSEGKADAIQATLEGPITAMVPATIVQMHQQAHVVLDTEAASKLEYEHHEGIVERK